MLWTRRDSVQVRAGEILYMVPLPFCLQGMSIEVKGPHIPADQPRSMFLFPLGRYGVVCTAVGRL